MMLGSSRLSTDEEQQQQENKKINKFKHFYAFS